MDLNPYLRKSASSRSRIPLQREKYWMEGGRALEADGNYLYYRSFCSERCKQKYIDSARSSEE